MERNLAIITGADGGMGTEITKAVAFAGYHVIMACYNPVKAEPVKQRIIRETGNNGFGDTSARSGIYGICIGLYRFGFGACS